MGAGPCGCHFPPPSPMCSPALFTRGETHGKGLVLSLVLRALSQGCDFSLQMKGKDSRAERPGPRSGLLPSKQAKEEQLHHFSPGNSKVRRQDGLPDGKCLAGFGDIEHTDPIIRVFVLGCPMLSSAHALGHGSPLCSSCEAAVLRRNRCPWVGASVPTSAIPRKTPWGWLSLHDILRSAQSCECAPWAQGTWTTSTLPGTTSSTPYSPVHTPPKGSTPSSVTLHCPIPRPSRSTQALLFPLGSIRSWSQNPLLNPSSKAGC